MLAQALSWHDSYHDMDGVWNQHDRCNAKQVPLGQ